MANGTANINRTFGTPTNNIKWTWSGWVKPSMAQEQGLFFGYVDANNYSYIGLSSTNQLQLYNHVSSSNAGNKKTNRVLRDCSAFYHIVVVFDSANVTAGDRMKIYVNGVRETSFASDTDPSSSGASKINGAWLHEVGAKLGSYDFSGVMSHVNFCDGQAYTPSDFGETNATDGMWQIITSPSVTYGNNGYFLKMEDSSNLDLDSSSNGATFSTTGTLTATKDNPSNNMSTLSPLVPYPSGLTMTNGNTSLASTATQWAGRFSTQRVFKGKYYVEAQFVSSGHNFKLGVEGDYLDITRNWSTLNQSYCGYAAVGYEYQCNNGTGYKVNNNSSPTWTNADFSPATSTIMMAFDLDNGKIWWGRNGTWFDTSGTANPATGADAAFTGITTANGPYLFGLSVEGNGSSSHINFGNGYYGTTAIGSPVTSNEGIWAYAPPTGFGAVTTAWINTF